MARHTVPMLEVYRYALSGAQMERGMAVGGCDDYAYLEQLDKDIEYLEKQVAKFEQKEKEK